MGAVAEKDMLVLRALNLGDLLVVVPALRALRQSHPQHRIVLATSPTLAALAFSSGAVDEVLPTAAPQQLRWPGHCGPAIAVNLHGNGPHSCIAIDTIGPRERIGFRSPGWDGPAWEDIAAEHRHERERWCALLQAFGIPADPTDLRLPPPAHEPPRPASVIVHPGAQYGSKRWPSRRFAAVAAALDHAGCHVVVTGSRAELTLADAIATEAGLPHRRVLAGATDLVQLSELVASATLLISGDTGVAHLAYAFGTPSVTLFGPAPPEQWGPPAGPHMALTAAAARRGDAFVDDPDPALLGVGVDDVLGAAGRLLGTTPERPLDDGRRRDRTC